MNNITGYVHDFHDTFDERAFTEVDSLILSQLSYLHYEHCGLHEGRQLQLGSLAAEMHNQDMVNVPSKNMMLELMYEVATNPRFKWLAATDYISHTDARLDKQFSATTYLFEDGAVYIAFRGTDGTVVGWKENFTMTYLPVIPSQQEAVLYLQAAAEKYTGPLYVGGHSKGGNLAVFAAASCKPAVQDRILSVFSHDGPGFQKEFFEKEGFQRIKARIHKTVPESAIIGMLLQHQEEYTVIESVEHGIFQHRAFTWVVNGGHFSVKEDINRSARIATASFNTWIDTLNLEQRKAIVDTVFQIVSATNAQTVRALLYETIRNAPSVVNVISNIDPDIKRLFLSQLTNLETLFERSGEEKQPKP